MKALIKMQKGYDCMSLTDITEPIAERDLVKIKVSYSGVCGTDLHAFEGVYAGTTPPVVLGHEFSGIVVDIGPDVRKIKVGDRVTSETTFETCGVCEFCLKKDYNLCSKRKGIGTQINGSFAEYVVSREESVHVIPDNVSLLSAALTEPLACVVHAALERTTINEGETIVVLGPGAIGLFASMTGIAKKANVILAGTGRDYKRFELAKKIGIKTIVNQQEEDLSGIVMAMTEGKGADKIFECSGAVQALNKAFEIAKKQAEIVQLGVFAKEINEVNLSYFFPKEIKYIGSRSQKPSTWNLTLKLMKDGLIEPEKIVTWITDLENWREAFKKSANCEEVKVVLKCTS